MALGTYYLNASGTLGGNGSGSNASNPVDCSTQVKLDAWWAANTNNGDTGGPLTMVYAPGLYQTLGSLSATRSTMRSGNIHVGSGIDQTIIQLVGASAVTTDGRIFSHDISSVHGWISPWGCYNMTLDGNATNQPKWTSAPGVVECIHCAGGDTIQIQNVKCINYGTSSVGRECFPCVVNANPGPTNRTMTNIVVDSCIFTQPAPGNKDGVSIVSLNDNPAGSVFMDNSCVVQNCQFLDVWSPTAGQPGDFSYSHCVGAPVVRNNYAKNIDIFWYTEPPTAGPQWQNVAVSVIQGNTVTGCNRFWYVSYHNSGVINGVSILSNNFQQYPTATTQGIQAYGSNANPAGTLGPFIVQNNVIQASTSQSTNAGIYGIWMTTSGDLNVQSLTITGNNFNLYPVGHEIKNTAVASPVLSGNIIRSRYPTVGLTLDQATLLAKPGVPTPGTTARNLNGLMNAIPPTYTLVTDIASVRDILRSVSVPLNYTQLIVAYAPNSSCYSVWGSSKINNAPDLFTCLYTRGDGPSYLGLAVDMN